MEKSKECVRIQKNITNKLVARGRVSFKDKSSEVNKKGMDFTCAKDKSKRRRGNKISEYNNSHKKDKFEIISEKDGSKCECNDKIFLGDTTTGGSGENDGISNYADNNIPSDDNVEVSPSVKLVNSIKDRKDLGVAGSDMSPQWNQILSRCKLSDGRSC